MDFDVQITGATFVTPEGRQRGTIAIREGRIAALAEEPSGSAALQIDATGLVVLPGMVDQHVHFMDPGGTERDDFITRSSPGACAAAIPLVDLPPNPHNLTVNDLR